jgi:hypothetical protein
MVAEEIKEHSPMVQVADPKFSLQEDCLLKDEFRDPMVLVTWAKKKTRRMLYKSNKNLPFYMVSVTGLLLKKKFNTRVEFQGINRISETSIFDVPKITLSILTFCFWV